MILVVVDFDNTLFRSPEQPAWWTKGYWYGHHRSLNPPCVPEEPGPAWWNQKTLQAARDALRDPERYCILLTGRQEQHANFATRIPELLKQQELDFKAVLLSPSNRPKEWKAAEILATVEANDIEAVELWDDQTEALEKYLEALREQGTPAVAYHVNSTPHACGCKTAGTGMADGRPSHDSSAGVARAARPRNSGADGHSPEGPAVSRATGRADRHHGRPMEQDTGNSERTVRLAQEPTEFEMTEELEQDPGANWRDLYLQPIIRAIRNRFDLDQGQVTLLSPKKESPFGSDTLGFEITGHVRFYNYEPPIMEYGRAPYRFTATVDTEGELQLPVDVAGV